MEEYCQHAAQHYELPLSKVDYAGGIVNDGKAQSDEGVDSARRKTG